MNPANINFTLFQGIDFNKTLTWLSGNPPVPVNLTGYTATLVFYDYEGNILHTSSTANSEIVLGGQLGTVQIVIPNSVTSTFTFDSGTYRLTLVNGSGKKISFSNGSLKLQWTDQ